MWPSRSAAARRSKRRFGPSACRRPKHDCGRLLVSLGLPTALDLRLLGGGPEVEEAMAELKAAGILAGDRAKVRLLVGDRAHLSGLSRVSAASASTDDIDASDDEGVPQRRRLQADAVDTASKAGPGMSMDTIAIMLTVLVGTAGYGMQAYLVQRAERSSESAAQELHVHEQEQEREHLQVVAKIKRTDRWLDGESATGSLFLFPLASRCKTHVCLVGVPLSLSAPPLLL